MHKQRDTYWDTLKGLLIFLVVLGHTGRCLGEHWTSVIYIFHMPLFIFVSGYLSNPKPIGKFLKGIKLLLGFYFLFHTFYLIYDITIGVKLTIERILTPSFGLWYLLSLCYWRCLLQVFHKLMIRFPIFIIVIAILLSVSMGFFPLDSEMSFQRTFTFFPFFVLGYYAKQFKWDKQIRRLNWVFANLILLILIVVVYEFIPPFYANTHYEGISNCRIRCYQLSLAFFISICIMRIVPQKLSVITDLGKYTLIVYLFHPPLILFCKRLFDSLHISQNPVSGIFISVITIVFISLIKDIKIIRFFNK